MLLDEALSLGPGLRWLVEEIFRIIREIHDHGHHRAASFEQNGQQGPCPSPTTVYVAGDRIGLAGRRQSAAPAGRPRSPNRTSGIRKSGMKGETP